MSCGAGVARSHGRGWSHGARENRSKTGHLLNRHRGEDPKRNNDDYITVFLYIYIFFFVKLSISNHIAGLVQKNHIINEI